MTTARNLTFLLCSAASLTVIGGARAADLPVKAKAVEYVRVCSLYGAGFFYIPGTDTCIKFGGYLRVDTTFNGGPQGQPAWNGDLGQQNRYADYFAKRARMAFSVDTRTQTEYGLVRTFGQADMQFSTLGGSTTNPNSLNTNLGNNPQLLDTVGGGYTSIEYIFIQFAGFTVGKSASAYASPWQGFPGNNTSFLLGGQNTDTGVNNIQYTAQFGNGVSASIGLDDPTVWDRTSLYNLSTGLNAAGVTGNAYGGVQSPDVVGNIRIDQAWGLFQISAAAHEVDGSYNILTATTAAPTNLSEISGHPETKWGGSVMAALNIKNIPTGAGDDIKVDVSYGRRLPSGHDQWNRAHGCLWRSRRVQPQLGSVLVVEPLRLGVLCAVRRRRQGRLLCDLCREQQADRGEHLRRFQLQPRLQRLPGGSGHALDTGQEPDFLGRCTVFPPRPEFHWHRGPDPIGPEARDGLRVQGPGCGLPAGSRPTQLLIVACAGKHCNATGQQ